jgi:SAM-dependent methyltransferase
MRAVREWTEANRRMWDERVPIHVGSQFYDVTGFKAGKPAVEPFEVDELGALGGLRLAHLQCHFGLDTLDLVRMHPTLEAVGLDFSAPAVEAATKLAAEMGLQDRCRFVQSDVYGAASALGNESFDVVYTGKGAIIWLPDLPRWAAECARLLKQGGWLYLCEFHPVGMTLDEDRPAPKYDYFNVDVETYDEPGTYADLEAKTVHNRSYEWNHPVSQVLDAILGAGLELRFFHEWDYTLYELTKWLVKRDDGTYQWPGSSRLPLMYSLKARKPSPAEP